MNACKGSVAVGGHMILGEALKYARDFKISEFKASKRRLEHRKKEATKSLVLSRGKRRPTAAT